MDKVRYFYHTEVDANDNKERTVAVAYTHSLGNDTTSYGAAMFRRESVSESFNKGPHRSTARSRLDKRPVIVNVCGETFDEVESNIREAIRTLGVSGRRNSRSE